MSKRYYTKVIGGHSLPKAPTSPKPEMKTRLKIHQSLGYRGYFWEVEGFFSLTDKMDPSWYGLGRGGYALTMWGAKLAGRRKIKQRKNFNATNKEWIFE